MKDYSQDYEEARTFILNYEVKDNKIIIKFANEEKATIPYTKENELKILNKMKQQILESGAFEKDMKEERKKYSSVVKFTNYVLAGLIIGLILLNLLIRHPALDTYIIEGIMSFLVGGFMIFCRISCKYGIKEIDQELEELEKNKMLLSHGEYINKEIKKNYNVLANTSEKIQEMVSSTPEDQPIFTLNNIDKIDYDELEQIYENIVKAEDVKCDDNEKVKVKKYHN